MTSSNASNNAPLSSNSTTLSTQNLDQGALAFSLNNFSTKLTPSSNSFNFGGKLEIAPTLDFKFGPTNILDKHKTLLSHSASNMALLDDGIIECASCDICFQDFSEVKCIPKVLECGHSICSVCLITLLDSKKTCPKCNEPLQKSSMGDYPTNYDLLSLSSSIRKYACSEPHVICSLESIKKLVLIRRESLVKSIADRTALKNMMTNDITRIEQMTDLDKDILVPGEAKILIKDIQDNIEKVEKVLNCCCNPVVKQTYSISQYKNSTQFLYDLSIRIYKRECIYACEMVDGQLKYGKIEFDDDRITVHALTSFAVNKNVSVVSLRDLKKCVSSENFMVFITIGNRTLLFKLIDTSIQCLQFIKLCTGETGPVLQGSSFAVKLKFIDTAATTLLGQPVQSTPKSHFIQPVQSTAKPLLGQPVQSTSTFGSGFTFGSFDSDDQNKRLFPDHASKTCTKGTKMLTIEHYMINSIKAKGCIDYDTSTFSKQSSTFVCEAGDVLLQCTTEGTCNIFKCPAKSTYKDVIGTLFNKDDGDFFSNVNDGFIDVSGIIFRM